MLYVSTLSEKEAEKFVDGQTNSICGIHAENSKVIFNKSQFYFPLKK
jgi:hypothetical protein